MKRIIVADDSSLARMFTLRTLSTAGYVNYEAEEAQDGQEVFALITEQVPDLVITDLNMPEMDGLELMERLSNDAVFSQIPVVVLTSGGSVEQRERLIELGAVAVLSKPIGTTDLEAVIGTLLEKEDNSYGY